MARRTLEGRLDERARAWALTGPPGRALAFGLDLGAALAALAQHGLGRLRRR